MSLFSCSLCISHCKNIQKQGNYQKNKEILNKNPLNINIFTLIFAHSA